MKRIQLCIFAAILTANFSFGQTNNYPTTGNVTINAGHLIQSGENNLQTQGAIKLKSYLLFDSDGDFTGGNYYTIQDNSTGNYLRLGYGWDDNLVINSSGFIGIGTTTPSSKLEVKAANKQIRILDSDAGGKRWTIGTSSNTDLSFHFQEDLSDKIMDIIRLKANGNVGIGTSSPNKKLVIDINSNNNDGIYLKGSAVNIRTTFSNNLAPTGSRTFCFNMHNSGNLYLQHLNDDLSWNKNLLLFNTNGNMVVYGKLEAKEIKVQLAPTADFVFNDDYKLRKITEVESFIKEHKHLPDFPSGKKIEENGINVGEMEARLLQKIEELTLYMIDQNKRIEKLEKENSLLKQKMNLD